MQRTNEIIYQPGEASWASVKCGGGPHLNGDLETVHPAVRTVEQIHRVGAVVVPYAGTETSILDKPSRPSIAVQYSKRAFLPA